MLVVVDEYVGFAQEVMAIPHKAFLYLTQDYFVGEVCLLTRKDHHLERTLDGKKLLEVFLYLIYTVPRIVKFALCHQDETPLGLSFFYGYI